MSDNQKQGTPQRRTVSTEMLWAGTNLALAAMSLMIALWTNEVLMLDVAGAFAVASILAFFSAFGVLKGNWGRLWIIVTVVAVATLIMAPGVAALPKS